MNLHLDSWLGMNQALAFKAWYQLIFAPFSQQWGHLSAEDRRQLPPHVW